MTQRQDDLSAYTEIAEPKDIFDWKDKFRNQNGQYPCASDILKYLKDHPVEAKKLRSDESFQSRRFKRKN